jgi:hypothetical protein
VSIANDFYTICKDLGIEYDDMLTDPKSFIRRVVDKATWISNELSKTNTLATIEDEFKSAARKNEPAKLRAEQIYNDILDIIAKEDAEVLVNLLPMLAEVTQFASNNVRAMSIRSSSTPHLSKRHLHLLYIDLKKCYDAYIGFMRLFHGADIGKPPIIPSKSGNYSSGSAGTGVKIYTYTIGKEKFRNPYEVAKMLGVDIKHYMDLTDIINANNGVVNGTKVKMEEI